MNEDKIYIINDLTKRERGGDGYMEHTKQTKHKWKIHIDYILKEKHNQKLIKRVRNIYWALSCRIKSKKAIWRITERELDQQIPKQDTIGILKLQEMEVTGRYEQIVIRLIHSEVTTLKQITVE